MPGVLQNALELVTHGEEAHVPSTSKAIHGVSRLYSQNVLHSSPTSFENCLDDRMMGKSRDVKGFPWDPRPCRYDEEESCNKVHATCARTLKFSTSKNFNYLLQFTEVDPPCLPLKSQHLTSPTPNGRPNSTDNCSSRLVDMPYGLMNPEAAKDETKSVTQALGIVLAARAEPGRSVWGLAVHGKSGTPWFDSGGANIGNYIYQIPQGDGLPADYYICDSRTHPSSCGLIGGNLQHACGEWYDPRQCHFCEDHGSSLTCEVRGWNDKYREWSRVPIYPRDMLGEMFRGEFADVVAKPEWAAITIPKWALRHKIREMPNYMVADGEARMVTKLAKQGEEPTPDAILGLMQYTDPHTLALAFLGPADAPSCRETNCHGFRTSDAPKVRHPPVPTRQRKKKPRASARDFF